MTPESGPHSKSFSETKDVSSESNAEAKNI